MKGYSCGLSLESYGLFLVLLSAILYAMAGAFVKLGHIRGRLPSTELVFARGIFQGGFILLGLFMTRDDKNQRLIHHPFGKGAAAKRLVWARGIIGGMGFLLDYHCMAVLPLGDAITLMSLYPFLTIFLAKFVLDEEIKILHIVVTTASLFGAVLIAQPTFVFGSLESEIKNPPIASLGYLTGCLGSICLACVVIMIRKAGNIGVHTFQLLFCWAILGTIFSILVGPMEGSWEVPSTLVVWGYVLGVCMFGAGAHFMLNYAGQLAPAGLVSVVRASDIMWAYAFEILIFEQRPNFWTWIGVVLVLGSLLAIAIDKAKLSIWTSTKIPSPKKISPIKTSIKGKDGILSDIGHDLESQNNVASGKDA
jgi:drug/metabolite transporter (DMT)-like permease